VGEITEETQSGKLLLNLGCGFQKKIGFVNVDAFDICKPDVVHDLNSFPYPWDDNSIDGIEMFHALEHLDDWWGAFNECARILKPDCLLDIRVPDESSASALCYRDHNHVFNHQSFHGIQELHGWGANAWACLEDSKVPLVLIDYKQVPFKEYDWMLRWPFVKLLSFCARHLRNFIWEQQFTFRKVGSEHE